MSFDAVQFTAGGRRIMQEAVAGKVLTFTKIQLGDGRLTGQAIGELTALVKPVLDVSISSITTKEQYANVQGSFDNSLLTQGFYWREIGVFAKAGADGTETLYAYGNAYELAEYIPAGGSEIVEKIVSVPIFVSNASHVTAVIDSSLIYASATELENHSQGKASLTKYGHTMLSSEIDSEREDLAATPKAVKLAIAEAKSNPQLELDVAEIKNKVGNTADAGATETSGTLMGKTNALLKGVGGRITSGNKKYSPIMYEQLVMVDKSPILGNNTNSSELLTTQGCLVVGDSFMYTYRRNSTSDYSLISVSLANNKIRTVGGGVKFSNDMSLKKGMNSTHLYYAGNQSGGVYKVDHRSDASTYFFNITGADIASLVVTEDTIYIYDKTTHKIMAYTTAVGIKSCESSVIGTSSGKLAVNGNYLVYLEGNSLYLLDSQNLSLLATISCSSIHNVFSYGEDFLCTSQLSGYTRTLKIDKTTPSSSNLEVHADLKNFAIEDLDYLSDGSIMLYSSDDRVNGAIHLIVSTSGEITRLSDNHDYINLRFGPMCIDKNTDCIYKIITSFRDIDPGPYAGVMYIGKFIKKHVIVGYDLEV